MGTTFQCPSCGHPFVLEDTTGIQKTRCPHCKVLVALPNSRERQTGAIQPTGDKLIRLNCQCGKQYAVKDTLAGKTTTCKHCGAKLVIPEPAVENPDGFPHVPRKMKPVLVVGIAIILLMLVGGGFYVYHTVKHEKDQQALREEVQRIVDEAAVLAKSPGSAIAASDRYAEAMSKSGGLDSHELSDAIRQDMDNLKPAVEAQRLRQARADQQRKEQEQRLAAQKAAEEERKRKQDEAKAAAIKRQQKEEEQRQREAKLGITIALVQKEFREGNFDSGDIRDKIIISFTFTNHLAKEVSAFTGTVVFADLFDREIKRVGITVEDAVKSGHSVHWDGEMNYNQFMDDDRRLRSVERQNLKVSFKLEAVIYKDGTNQKFAE